MTGRGIGWGYRYSMLCAEWVGALVSDSEVGALDSSVVVPAGSHCSPWWLDGVAHCAAVTRVGGFSVAVPVSEWRS